MNLFRYRTRRSIRDDIVERLDEESEGSFATLSKALDNVASKYPANTDLKIEEVVAEIRRVNASQASKPNNKSQHISASQVETKMAR
jgi:hypothetical protein